MSTDTCVRIQTARPSFALPHNPRASLPKSPPRHLPPAYTQEMFELLVKFFHPTRRIDRCYPRTDRRNTVVRVENDCVPYLTSRPIPERYRLRSVLIRIDSEIQGCSSYGNDSGLHWAPFELSLRSTKHSPEADDEGEEELCDGALREKWRGKVIGSKLRTADCVRK